MWWLSTSLAKCLQPCKDFGLFAVFYHRQSESTVRVKMVRSKETYNQIKVKQSPGGQLEDCLVSGLDAQLCHYTCNYSSSSDISVSTLFTITYVPTLPPCC